MSTSNRTRLVRGETWLKRRLRLWAVVVLTIAFLGWLGGRLGPAWYLKASANPEFFAADVAKFATADRDHPPPDQPIVFVGSSSIRLWDTLQRDMAPLPVMNRGFGGARLSSVVHFVDRVVIQYRPRAVVLYAGDNDLDAGQSAGDVVRDFKAFVTRVQSALPEARIYYLSLKPSRRYWTNWPRYQQANAQISAMCASDSRLTYIDVAAPLLAYGQPPPRDLFRLDQMHLSAKGYAIWAGIIRARLQEDLGDTARDTEAISSERDHRRIEAFRSRSWVGTMRTRACSTTVSAGDSSTRCLRGESRDVNGMNSGKPSGETPWQP
jgi:lysophospholipase L1-like esterase